MRGTPNTCWSVNRYINELIYSVGCLCVHEIARICLSIIWSKSVESKFCLHLLLCNGESSCYCWKYLCRVLIVLFKLSNFFFLISPYVHELPGLRPSFMRADGDAGMIFGVFCRDKHFRQPLKRMVSNASCSSCQLGEFLVFWNTSHHNDRSEGSKWQTRFIASRWMDC